MRKNTAIIALVILLTLTIFSQIISSRVNAADVKITFISPATQRGKVGDTVRVTGTINTTNGLYQIWFGNNLKVSETASGNNVNTSLIVPAIPSGNYTITLRDVAANINATSWFIIEAAYIIKVGKPEHPKQLQQGAKINISVSITGGGRNKIYVANITVKTPAANETYSRTVQFSNTTDTGVGNATITYPFGNAHTNYVGAYTVVFNATLASDAFFIGLTELQEYHRGDTMKIWAVGYSAHSSVNISIKSEEGKEISRFTQPVKNGVIDANWPIPSDMLVGNYSISILTTSKAKLVNDTQIFAVPGYTTEIVPCNLAGEPVPNVLIRVYDKWADKTYNVTSNGKGVAIEHLEKGEYNATAYFKKVRVGKSLLFNVEDEGKTLNFTCQLTSLNITVVSLQEPATKIPEVLFTLYYNFTTDLDGRRTVNETIFFQTGITGNAKQHSLLLNAFYKMNASRYGQIFNQTTFTLETCAWNNITVVCPERVLHVRVTDGEGKPIANAMVEIQEFMGGLYNNSLTNHGGEVTLRCIFGKYYVRVYSNGVLLNKTVVELFSNKNLTIYCALYKLPIYVKVIDYFGQPISNANVALERDGTKIQSNVTNADGITSFRENGGKLTIKVYLTKSDLPETTLTVYVDGKRESSNPVLVKIGKYIVLAGFLVDAAQFAIAILVVATVILIAVIEIVKRKHLKPGKTSS